VSDGRTNDSDKEVTVSKINCESSTEIMELWVCEDVCVASTTEREREDGDEADDEESVKRERERV
jgi:hypothetical protein